MMPGPLQEDAPRMPRVVPAPVQALFAAMVAGLLAACGAPNFAAKDGEMTRLPAESVSVDGLRLPATFRGKLPCADCAGVRHHLDLWPDHVFHLRREWLGRDMVHGDVGRWRVDAERRVLVLQGGTEMPLQFQILGPDRIRQMDLEGKPIVSDLPYELQSDGALDPTDVSLFLGGQMTYQADGARFTECLTGRSYPIAAGGEAERLQQAYLADVAQPGTALFVSFEGTITRRPGLESGQIEPVVTIQRFISTRPGRHAANVNGQLVCEH